MTGTITLDGELELEETTDADGNKAWRIVDANGNRRKLILGEADIDELFVKDAKLASTGDYVNLATYTPMESADFKTTSGTYVAADNFGWRISWDDHVPANANTAMAPLFSVVPGTDETVDVQLFNQIDNEVVFEKTGITGTGPVNPGPISYTPPTTAQRVRFQIRIRTDPGANNSNIKEPHCYAGVQL